MNHTSPVSRDVAKRQPDQFCCCIIGQEVASGLDNLAQMRVDILNGVRRITDTNNDVLQTAHHHLKNNLEQMRIEPSPVLEKVHLCCDLAESVSGANLVIEAAPECTALKQKLLLEVLQALTK